MSCMSKLTQLMWFILVIPELRSEILSAHYFLFLCFYIVSSRVSAQPWNIELTLFYLAPHPPPPPKTSTFPPPPPPPPPPKKPKPVPPPPPFPFPSKSWRTWLPCPWDVHLSKTQKIHFLIKKNNSNNEMRAHLNVEIWIYSCKT